MILAFSREVPLVCRRRVLWSWFALFLAGAPAHADVFVGSFGAAGDPDIVRVFADTANGDVAPIRLLGGPAALLESANDLLYEPSEHVLYVADFRGQAIRVFAFGAEGNVPPLRSFSGPVLGQPRDLVIVPAHQEILTIASNSFVATYDQFASGTVAHLRLINFGAVTQLNNPAGLAYWPPTDEIYVGEADANGGKVLVFPRTANGNVAPSRVISGAGTQLGDYVMTVVVHPSLPELYVLAGGGSPDTGRIVTFAVSAAGNATPTRVIAGGATLLTQAHKLEYDAGRDEFVVVVSPSAGGSPAVLRFPRTAQGNAAPSGNLSGPSTGVSSNTYAVLVAASNFIFRDGFETVP
jgi:hypothetical protein